MGIAVAEVIFLPKHHLSEANKNLNKTFARYLADFSQTYLRNHHERDHICLLLRVLLRTLLHGTAEAATGQEASPICFAHKTEPVVSCVITMPLLWHWDESNVPQTLKGNMHLHRLKTEGIRSIKKLG